MRGCCRFNQGRELAHLGGRAGQVFERPQLGVLAAPGRAGVAGMRLINNRGGVVVCARR